MISPPPLASHQRTGAIYRWEYKPSQNSNDTVKKITQQITTILNQQNPNVQTLVLYQSVWNDKRHLEFFSGQDATHLQQIVKKYETAAKQKLHKTEWRDDFYSFCRDALNTRPYEEDFVEDFASSQYYNSRFDSEVYNLTSDQAESISPRQFIRENRKQLPLLARLKAFFHLTH
jgi:hypothetical protein